LPDPKYAQPETRAAFVRQVLERLDHLPGATAVAAINAMPLTKANVWNGFNLPGGNEIGTAGLRAVSPGYFQAMGIPLLRGRLLAPGDTRGVGVINRAMAERYWPNQDPIGKTIETPRVVRVETAGGFDIRLQPEQFQIVGIVGDVRHLSLDYDPQPEMLLPYAQMATSDVTFLLRGVVAPRDARTAIWAVDRDQPLAAVRTMDQLISDDVAPRRFVLLLLGVFAGVALALAAAGIFGVVLHSVSERTREIGIRMALGAGLGAVVRMAVRQALVWIGIGLALGTVGALAAVRLLAGYLYAVRPRDPAALAIAVAVLAALGALAAFLPARAAARVDPATTLRCE
jgi:putative ABC transport system permease protein